MSQTATPKPYTELREAVRAFLLLRLSDAHREFEHPMIDAALRDYWTADAVFPGA